MRYSLVRVWRWVGYTHYESFTNDPWVVVWSFKDKIEGGRISHDGGGGNKYRSGVIGLVILRSQNSPVGVSNSLGSVQRSNNLQIWDTTVASG